MCTTPQEADEHAIGFLFRLANHSKETVRNSEVVLRWTTPGSRALPGDWDLSGNFEGSITFLTTGVNFSVRVIEMSVPCEEVGVERERREGAEELNTVYHQNIIEEVEISQKKILGTKETTRRTQGKLQSAFAVCGQLEVEKRAAQTEAADALQKTHDELISVRQTLASKETKIQFYAERAAEANKETIKVAETAEVGRLAMRLEMETVRDELTRLKQELAGKETQVKAWAGRAAQAAKEKITVEETAEVMKRAMRFELETARNEHRAAEEMRQMWAVRAV
jgi:hypothetical protein